MANATNVSAIIEPLANLIGVTLDHIQVLVGGVFGLYLIMLILRVYEIKYLKNRFDKIEKMIKRKR